MPFTISHAAAALPLRRLGRFNLPLAAVMIGSQLILEHLFYLYIPWFLGPVLVAIAARPPRPSPAQGRG